MIYSLRKPVNMLTEKQRQTHLCYEAMDYFSKYSYIDVDYRHMFFDGEYESVHFDRGGRSIVRDSKLQYGWVDLVVLICSSDYREFFDAL